jgi:hypothetical protein
VNSARRRADIRDDFKRPGAPSNEPELYLKIFDRDGNQIQETAVMNTPFAPLVDSGDIKQCEVGVVGSGFGGTIVSLSLVNQLHEEDKLMPDPAKRKVVLLERGQWWTSHEVPKSRDFNEQKSADSAQHSGSVLEYS